LGGSINYRTNANAARYRLHNKDGMLNTINFLDGRLQHPIRIAQFLEVQSILNLKRTEQNYKLISPTSAWLAGFIDAEGSFNCNQTTFQLSFSIGQKDTGILTEIQKTFKIGYVYKDKDTFKLYLSSKEDLQFLFIYLEQFSLKIPTKKADYVTFKRLFHFKTKKYHFKEHPLHYRFVNLSKLLKNRSSIQFKI